MSSLIAAPRCIETLLLIGRGAIQVPYRRWMHSRCEVCRERKCGGYERTDDQEHSYNNLMAFLRGPGELVDVSVPVATDERIMELVLFL